MHVTYPYIRRLGTSGLVAALLVLAAAGCEDDRVTGVERPGASQLSRGRATEMLKVMTFNVYVGGNVDRIIEEPNPMMIPVRVAETFAEVEATNFHARAEAFAAAVAVERPHLIGLQEVSEIFYQTPGDAVYGGTNPATMKIYDYLQILTDALDAHGLDYEVAGAVENFDIEMPMMVEFEPPYAFDDVRLVDWDVVLARGDVDVGNVVEQNYASVFQLPGIDLPRGYVAVDATVNDRTYRFVSTHLEAESDDVRFDQAEELVYALAGADKPVIVVGDLNTWAPTGAVYQYFESQGYLDVWTRNHEKGAGAGLTNMHDDDLRNTTVNFDRRIDLIFVRNNGGNSNHPALGPVYATVWGDELSDRLWEPNTGDMIWPSDHAAVIAEMWIPMLGNGAYK